MLADANRTASNSDPKALRYGSAIPHPRKILELVNTANHASDLNAPYPTEPASFISATTPSSGRETQSHCPRSRSVTAEAEIGVIIGRKCAACPRNRRGSISRRLCLIIDMTAEDILQKNPRFLPARRISIPSFFRPGVIDTTADECRMS